MVRRAFVVAGLLTATVFGAVVVSSTASDPLFGGSRPAPVPSTEPAPRTPPGPPASVAGAATDPFPRWLVIVALTLLVGYAVCLLLLVVLHRRGRLDAPPALPAGAEGAPADSEWVARLSVALGTAARVQLVAMGLGTPRDAIVACWIRLHLATQRVGLEQRPSETPQEFTERALRGLRVDETSLTTLAALYREARFSDHPMDDDQRQQAADALRVLAGQLAGRTVPA